jgi:hypothetical protein
MKSILIVLFLFAVTLDTTHASVQVPEYLLDSKRPKTDDPDTLVHGFLDAVDRGELIICGRRLDRSMIVPVHVEYVYELASRVTRVKIHSNLKEPMSVPDRPDCRVFSVGVVMADGKIIEIESHVWMRQ